MMALQHAKTGIVLGAGVADLVHSGFLVGAVLILLTTGAALLPDLDMPRSTAARAFGPLSRVTAQGIGRVGVALYTATATRYDRPCRDGHRAITHTVVFAVALGAGVAALDAVGGRWALLGTVFVLSSLAVRGITAPRPQRKQPGPLARLAARLFAEQTRRRAHRFHSNAISVSLYAAALTLATYATVPQVNPLLVGACVALGCWTHCLGDSCTLDGCPWLFPLVIKGRRWYPIGTPRRLRFRTGGEGGGERRFGVALNMIATVLVVLMAMPLATSVGTEVRTVVATPPH